jgi:Rod binding domain-containing protein
MQVHGVVIGVEGSSRSAVSENRLIRAAHEFEGQMLKELLKPLASGGLDGGGDEGESNGVLGDFAAEALGRGLSERGGVGIATQILGHLSRTGNTPGTATVTGDGHLNTRLRGFEGLES